MISVAASAVRHSPVDDLAEEWRALADEVGAEPWHRPGWIRAWWNAFGRGRLRVATVRRDGVLVGVAPFADVRGGRRATANWHTPSFALLAADSDARAELAARLLEDRPGWIHVPFVDGDEADALREAGAASRYRALERTAMRSPYLLTAAGEDAMWESGGGDRKRVRRLDARRRKLESRGDVEFTTTGGGDDPGPLLDEGFRVEAASWKGERGTAILSSPETTRFYTEVARWAHARGTLRLFFVRVGGRAVAFELCIEDCNRLYNLKGGHDPAWRPFAVGLIARRMMIDHALGRGLESFEFLGSDEAHKLQWTSLVRERRLVQLFGPSLRGATAHAAYAYGRPAAKWLLRRTS